MGSPAAVPEAGKLVVLAADNLGLGTLAVPVVDIRAGPVQVGSLLAVAPRFRKVNIRSSSRQDRPRRSFLAHFWQNPTKLCIERSRLEDPNKSNAALTFSLDHLLLLVLDIL